MVNNKERKDMEVSASEVQMHNMSIAEKSMDVNEFKTYSAGHNKGYIVGRRSGFCGGVFFTFMIIVLFIVLLKIGEMYL